MPAVWRVDRFASSECHAGGILLHSMSVDSGEPTTIANANLKVFFNLRSSFMTSRNSKTNQVQHINSAQNVPANMLSNLARQQLAIFNDAACTMFRGFETMREIQKQAAHQASSHHETAAARLRSVHEAVDVMAVESDLLRFDLEGAAQYWQQLVATGQQTQIEMMNCAVNTLSTNLPNSVRSAVEAWQSMLARTSIPEGARSQVDAAS
jgi:hypothetical protein